MTITGLSIIDNIMLLVMLICMLSIIRLFNAIALNKRVIQISDRLQSAITITTRRSHTTLNPQQTVNISIDKSNYIP